MYRIPRNTTFKKALIYLKAQLKPIIFPNVHKQFGVFHL